MGDHNNLGFNLQTVKEVKQDISGSLIQVVSKGSGDFINLIKTIFVTVMTLTHTSCHSLSSQFCQALFSSVWHWVDNVVQIL